jgi:hypothetical protein
MQFEQKCFRENKIEKVKLGKGQVEIAGKVLSGHSSK